MSDLIVEPTRVKEVRTHPNADKLDLAIVKGWQIVVGKGQFKAGDSVIFVPPDAMVPKALAEKYGVWKYLAVKKDAEIGRVKSVKLRQEMSFGFVVANDEKYPEGKDLKEILGITKYEPPTQKLTSGDIERDNPLFDNYTDIQNIRNYNDIIPENEEVVFTEKIHGTNARIGIILDPESDGLINRFVDYIKSIFGTTNELRNNFGLFSFMIGSHEKRRKLGKKSLYEIPLTLKMRQFLLSLRDSPPDGITESIHSIIVYGEIFGGNIQDLQYGHAKEPTFQMFDIKINGRYLDWEQLPKLSEISGIPLVPFLYKGPMNQAVLAEHTNGPTTLMEDGAHMREGVVVKPVRERFHPAIGRVILKSISNDYLLRKDGTEFH